MELNPQLLPVLAVALITWGGVFVYMLRMQAMMRDVEKEVAQVSEKTPDS